MLFDGGIKLLLGELPKEPEWAQGLTEAEANPATAFYWRTDVLAQLASCATQGFCISLKYQIKAQNETVNIVISLNELNQYFHFID